MQEIQLVNQREYAYHGCLEEESIIGSEYITNLKVFCDLHNSATKDDLKLTVDYVDLRSVVSQEMQKRSKLLESVCLRITNRLFNEFPLILKVNIKICKLNPPINGDVEQVCVSFSKEKS
tara:strand:+ start:498 stop:857 length:360 start_codon:yes stop_codon:yes gene_type:complete